jgi:hypothetical protein
MSFHFFSFLTSAAFVNPWETYSSKLLDKLMTAKSDQERSWIVTENWLESLPEDLITALWAMAVPHWFDADILVALCPELIDRSEEIYRQLQDLSCVEVFAERGYNVHELTRNQLLDQLWKDNPERFCDLSGRAAVYFAKRDKPEVQIEWIYHLVVVEPLLAIVELQNLAQRWDNACCKSELESLLTNLQKQIDVNRTKVRFKIEDLKRDKATLTFYHELEDRGSALKGMINLDKPLETRGFHSERTFPSGHYQDRLEDANNLRLISGQRVGEIVVAGRRVPIYFESSNGQIVVPSNIERKIVLDFLGQALATPVTAITIVGGSALRDIRLTFESVVQDIDSEVYRIRAEAEIRKINTILHIFGKEIEALSSYNYPEDIKRVYRQNLMQRMTERLKSLV